MGMVVMRCYFQCGMQLRGDGATNHNRGREAGLLHLVGYVYHLFERRGNQSRQTEQVGLFVMYRFDDFFRRYHHAEVDHFVIITCQYNRDDVFADVVHIAFNGSKDDLAGFGRTGRCFLRFDGRLKDGDGFLHRTCRFHDLRQEHFSRTEQLADYLKKKLLI